MAFTPIDTGYKPEFSLGALYQGMNAGNAEDMNQLELVKQFLANQREQQSQPYDLDVKQYESALANAKRNSPTYIPKSLTGYEGQMDSQIAAGKKATGTVDSEILAGNATNKETAAAKEAELFYQNKILDAMRRGAQPPSGGTIGFPMQSSQSTDQPTSGFSWQIPPNIQQSRDANAGNLMITELGGREAAQERLRELNRALSAAKGDARGILQGEISRLTAGLNSENSPTGISTDQTQEPTQVAQTDSLDYYRQLLGNNPKYWGAMELQKLHNEGIVDAARARAHAYEKSPVIEQYKQLSKLETNIMSNITQLIKSNEANAATKKMIEDLLQNRDVKPDPNADMSAVNQARTMIDYLKSVRAHKRTIEGHEGFVPPPTEIQPPAPTQPTKPALTPEQRAALIARITTTKGQ